MGRWYLAYFDLRMGLSLNHQTKVNMLLQLDDTHARQLGHSLVALQANV